jgi:hypothetical protein
LTGSAITEEKPQLRRGLEGEKGRGQHRGVVDYKGLLSTAISDATTAALAGNVSVWRWKGAHFLPLISGSGYDAHCEKGQGDFITAIWL